MSRLDDLREKYPIVALTRDPKPWRHVNSPGDRYNYLVRNDYNERLLVWDPRQPHEQDIAVYEEYERTRRESFI
jgi:hypothetical protein